jgi:hypothetical protein
VDTTSSEDRIRLYAQIQPLIDNFNLGLLEGNAEDMAQAVAALFGHCIADPETAIKIVSLLMATQGQLFLALQEKLGKTPDQIRDQIVTNGIVYLTLQEEPHQFEALYESSNDKMGNAQESLNGENSS